MTALRLRGISHADVPGWVGLDPTTIVPEAVPVYVEYDSSEPVGTASLRRDGNSIWADATVEDGPWREACKYLAMSFRVGHLAGTSGRGSCGEAISVSLTHSVLSNKVGDYHPPFEIVSDTAEEDFRP